MKLKFLAAVLAISFLAPAVSWAGRADGFRGWYEILSRKDLSKPYFLFEADTLGNIWAKYGEGPLPADLEQYRNEPSILAGFTDRSLIFFGLERGAIIADGYVAIQGGEGEQLELRRRPDGQFDMVATEKGKDSLYLLAPPKASPETTRIPLIRTP